MKYYITKYALTSGIQIVQSNHDNNLDNKFNNDERGCVFQYNYLIKNKEIFRNKEDAEKNFEEIKLKKIESLKKQLSKLEIMTIKYEKESK